MIEPTDADDDALSREAMAWLSRVALGEATPEDLAALRRWRDRSPQHAAALARAGRLWRGLKGASEDMLRSGEVTLPPTATGGNLHRRALLVGTATAAAATAAALLIRPPLHLWPSLEELKADYRTATGEQRDVSLTDTVRVRMNTQTSMSAGTPDGAPGVVLISGEVAVTLDPKRSDDFVVIARPARISAAHGTFNLRSDNAVGVVTCLSGELTIACDGRTVALRAAQRVGYDARGIGEIAAADPETNAWRQGMLVFHDTPLARVIDEVNRYRSGRIILMDATLGRRPVTARFELNRLDTVMSQIRHVFNAPVKTLPGGIVLVG